MELYLLFIFSFTLYPACRKEHKEKLSGKTQRRALPRHHSEKIIILNISFPRVGIEPTTYHGYSHTFVPLCHD